MSVAWSGPAPRALTAEPIILDTQPCIRVKTRSGHLVGYFADIPALSARLANLGYAMADVDIKEPTS